MRALILNLLILLSCSPAFGQNKQLDSLLNVLPNSANDSSRVKILNRIVKIYTKENPPEAIPYAKEAISIAVSTGYDSGLAEAYMNFGALYAYQEARDLAMEYYFKALAIYENKSDSNGIAHTLNAIGNVYLDENEEDIARENFKKSQEIFIKIGKVESSLYPAHNLAVLLSNNGLREEALAIYFENLAYSKTYKNWVLEAATLNNIGNNLNEMGKPDSALIFLNQALQVKLQHRDFKGATNTRVNLAKAYIQLDSFEVAQVLLDSALADARGFKVGQYEMDALVQLSGLYRKQGMPDRALLYFMMYDTLRDSFNDIERTEAIASIQQTREMKNRELEIEDLHKQKESEEKQKLILLSGLGVFFLLAVALFTSNRARTRVNKVLSQKSEEIARQNEEIERNNIDLQGKNERLEDLMREKDGLIGIVAHDLKAPLNRTLGLANLVEMSGPLAPEQVTYLKMIEKVAEDGSALIRDLLDLNSVEDSESRMEVSKFDISAILSESAHGFAGEANKKDISLVISAEDEILVQTEKSYILRVLDNLISNALKFSPKGKSVYVKAMSQNGHVILTVKDEGPGMMPEDLKKMFKKFQKLSAKPTGGESSTGLGLAITKALVEKLKGKIEVVSEPGAGAEFILTIPRKL